MKCPACRRVLAEAAALCPHCRLTLHKLDLKFGAAPRHFGPFTDRTLTFSRSDERKLQILLRLFRRKFPQSAFSVFVAELPAGTAIAEYSFWLANRVRFSAIESTAENNFDILLVLDVAGAAGLTIGYGLENYVQEDDLCAALEAGQTAFAAKDWTVVIECCVHHMMERMREICRAEKR